MSYDQNSPDAMFSRIMEKLAQQSKDTADHRAELIAVLSEVRNEVKLTNGRVRGLERWRDVITARVIGMAAATSCALGVAAWVIDKFIR